MGKALKAVATGGLSLLPGKAGKIATAGLTGGASLLPGKLGQIAGTVATGMPIFKDYEKRKKTPLAPTPAPVAGIGGPEVSASPAGGLISEMIGGPEVPTMEEQETPRQRVARQMAQKASRAARERVNPAEVRTRPIAMY